MPAPKGNNFNPEGRKPKDIDWKLFRSLCGLMCTQAEMAGVLGIGRKALGERVVKEFGKEWDEVYDRFSAHGKLSLRRYQFNLAKTNATMAIWLGKQWLGQRESPPDAMLPDELLKPFVALMQQLSALQARKIDESNIISEQKSACEIGE